MLERFEHRGAERLIAEIEGWAFRYILDGEWPDAPRQDLCHRDDRALVHIGDALRSPSGGLMLKIAPFPCLKHMRVGHLCQCRIPDTAVCDLVGLNLHE